MKRLLSSVILIVCLIAVWSLAQMPRVAGQTTRPTTRQNRGGEAVPSEDPIIRDLHSLGLLGGTTNIFRSACPVRDIAAAMSTTQPTDEEIAAAQARMQHLYDLGIRTDISFQTTVKSSASQTSSSEAPMINLERAAAQRVGIVYINDPMGNAGPDSLQTMTDAEVQAWLDQETSKILASSRTGGVVFHCAAGHDRAGIVAAYLRIKYQGWPVDQAIDEMRRLGHSWTEFSANGGLSSWHEDHLRAIAASLASPATAPSH